MAVDCNYYCSKCGKRERINAYPSDLKLALNPDLAIKEPWDDEDWNRPIGMCECGGEILPGFPKNRNKNIMIGNSVYIHTKYSDSLAINPNQIPEHKRLFPDVKLDTQGRPGFDTVGQHDDYLKKTGFIKQPQKIKIKGKDITPKKATSKA